VSTQRVRVATQDDVAVVLPMMVDFNRFEGIAWTAEAGEEPLRRLLGDASLGLVGLVERDALPVGYFVLTWGYDLEWNGRDAFLTELYLAPAERGRRLGDAVLAQLEDLARRHEARALHLMVRHDNAPARRLYERAGYRSPPREFLTKVL